MTLILRDQTNNTLARMTIGYTPMKTPDYSSDTFLLNTVAFMPLIFILSYIAPVFRVIALVVAEKESKVREGMRMMGLKDSAYWISWFLQYLIINVVIALGVAGIACGWLFIYTSYGLFFLFIFLYGMAIYAFALFLASFFYMARLASIVGCMIYFACYILGELIIMNDVNEVVKDVVSIFPPIALSFACQSIVELNVAQIGMQMSSMSMIVESYRLNSCLIIMAASFVLYFLLSLYCDNIIPNQSGVSRSYFYFLTKSYWREGTEKITPSDLVQEADAEKEGTGVKTYEPVSETLKAKEAANECLKVTKLQKEYFNGTKAVQGITLTMYKGQIFALLGHNGAGKTTTISMLTGAEDSTGGSAKLFGIPLFENMAVMRTMLGVCPQHDVLFEKLTPREHLEIFATFKGMTSEEKIRAESTGLLDELLLTGAENQEAAYLSGGEKRKLSIAISFIGDSKIILLDEPTSGMDMSSRRTVWRMLKKNKTDRIVILTTHYMDEADYLGDRIAIMAKGKIVCLGSSFFLKREVGEGYHLALVKKEGADSEKIGNLIRKYAEKYTVLSDVSQEFVIQLSKTYEENFKKLFEELDAKLEELNIESYGISVTTLEEVFLQVGKGEKEDEEKKLESKSMVYTDPAQNLQKGTMAIQLSKKGSIDDEYTIADENSREQGDCNLFCIHTKSILMKRLLYIKRGVIQLISELMVPLLLVLFGLSLTQIAFFKDSSPRVFDISLYPLPQHLLVNPSINNLQKASLAIFSSYFRPGMVCDYFNVSDSSNTWNSLKEMESYIFLTRQPLDSNRYGSTFISTLDNVKNIYELTILASLYSQESTVVFNNLLGEAIVRMAANKPNLQINIYTAPLPLTYLAKDLENRKNGNALGQSIVLAFALMPATVISSIVKEKQDNLKHQQIISGISLTAYWLGNSVVDFFKTSLPCFISIGLIFAFSVDLPYAWVMIFSYAFSIVPFTYSTAYFFSTEAVAQVGTLMLHVFFGQILPPVTLIMRLFDSSRSAGKALAWIFRLVPSFCLCNGIRLVSTQAELSTVEGSPTLYPELDIVNLAGGDLLFLWLDMVIYIVVLIILESRIIPRLIQSLTAKK